MHSAGVSYFCRMKAYCISGLGADERIFCNLHFPEALEPVYLKWIKPKPNETLEQYAMRLSEKIEGDEPFVLIGLSLGGMLAVEISKKKHPLATILISSAATSKELPGLYRWAGQVGLHKLLPAGLYKTASFMKRYFTTESTDSKKLVQQLIREADPAFIRWGVNAIVQWKNDEVPERVYRIHGTRDEILPLKNKDGIQAIPGGKHLMILDRAGEINPMIEAICANACLGVHNSDGPKK